MSDAIAKARARKDNDPSAGPTEAARVVLLPRKDYSGYNLTPELENGLNPGRLVLRPLQSAALLAMRDAGGLFAPIGVGHGKSLIGILAGTVLKRRLTIILAPSGTVPQLRRQLAEARRYFQIRSRVVIVAYSMLSRASGTDVLERILKGYEDSDAVLVSDECHRLKRNTAARTKRVIRFLQKHHDVAFVAMSGTITNKSLVDYAHLAEMALRHKSPLPRGSEIKAWAEALDAEGKPGHHDWEEIRLLWDAFGEHRGRSVHNVQGQERKSIARRAFQSRLRSSPGVVASEAGSLGCSLVIGLRMPEVPGPVAQALEYLEEEGEDPGGEIAPDDISKWRLGRQLSAGFWYEWVWPGEPDIEWLMARSAWNRCVRQELQGRSAEGYDSPFLVREAVLAQLEALRQAELEKLKRYSRSALQESWTGWDEERHKPPPPVVAKWIDRFLIFDATGWARSQDRPVIVWYESRAVAEALAATGMRVYGAGDDPPTLAHTCAMSVRAQGEGLNLQDWNRCLVMEPPTSGKTWEQLLGRTHRAGQKADEVEWVTYRHTEPFREALRKARMQATYIQDSTGNVQKLCFATYNT